MKTKLTWLIIGFILGMIVKSCYEPTVVKPVVEKQPVATPPTLIEREWSPTPKKRIEFEKPW